jgi:hypothetical protein
MAEQWDIPFVDAIATEIGTALNFTLGISNLDRVPIAEQVFLEFSRQLAMRLDRSAFCIQAFQDTSKLPKGRKLVKLIDGRVCSEDSSAYVIRSVIVQRDGKLGSFMEQSDLSRLPIMKRNFPLIVLDVGSVEDKIAESLGRLCDAVYVVAPSDMLISPNQAIRSVVRLQRAGVRIQGCWGINKAA